MSESPEPEAQVQNPLDHYAAWGYLGLAVVAICLRLMSPTGLGVEHFDEGVYASNLYAGHETLFTYPEQHLYAPPLVPTAIEVGIVAVGPTSLATCWLSLVLAGVTCWGVGHLGKAWFGTPAGWIAAILVAGSDYHILFSRTALTDVPLGGWWVLTTLALWKGITEQRLSFAVLSGVCCGLSWWTKYNGWMPLAFAALGLLSWSLIRPSSRGYRRQAWICWGVAVIVANLVWSPWLWQLQARGGYQSVMANHRQYIVGINGWWNSVTTHLEHLSTVTGGVTVLSLSMALLIAAWNARFTWNKERPASDNPSPEQSQPANLSEAACRDLALIWWGSWFLGLLALTPMYLPYARLMLPWWLSLQLGLGWGLALLVRRMGWASGLVSGLAGLAIANLVMGMSVGLNGGISSPCWEHRDGVEATSREILDQIDSDALVQMFPFQSATILVYGEPAFHFHLSRVLRAPPVSHLRFALPDAPRIEAPVYLLIADHAERDPQFLEQWSLAKARLRPVYSTRYSPSLVVRLDDAAAGRDHERRVIRVQLYRVR